MQRSIAILVAALAVFLATMAVAFGGAWAMQLVGDDTGARLLAALGAIATVGLVVCVLLLVMALASEVLRRNSHGSGTGPASDAGDAHSEPREPRTLEPTWNSSVAPSNVRPERPVDGEHAPTNGADAPITPPDASRSA